MLYRSKDNMERLVVFSCSRRPCAARARTFRLIDTPNGALRAQGDRPSPPPAHLYIQ
jgi:hypothetical protein